MACGALVVAGVNIDRSIGLSGTIFAILTFGLQQVQSRNPPRRTVTFLPKSRSSFARNIFRGLVECLGTQTGIHVRSFFPDEDPPDALAWQLERLSGKDVRNSDALVVIPAADDERLWTELAVLVRSGMTIVAVDVKPPNRLFATAGVPRPHFVGSDFSAGGDIVAGLLGDSLESYLDAEAVVAVGPDVSWPARERSSRILYRLAARELAPRLTTVPLMSWNAARSAEPLADAARARLTSRGRTVFVFCGNDKILMAVHSALAHSCSPQEMTLVNLIGYDGTTQEDDTLLIGECSTAYATIDTLPVQQGRVAGEYILDAYEGGRSAGPSRFIEPTLRTLTPNASTSMVRSG